MTPVSICIPYYENPSMLALQIETWNAYSPETRQVINVVLIDDGSPRNPAKPVIEANPCAIKIGLWRIAENIPWNQHGARNLAAKVAGKDDRWLLMTDVDHILEPKHAAKLIAQRLDPKFHYTFDRISLPYREPYKRHCNSFLLTREAYWKAGGYDEDYCGSYGGDGPFLRALAKVAPERRAPVTIVRVPRDVLADASTTEWPRVGPMKETYRARQLEKNKTGDIVPKNPLRFTWERQL